jgi:hypothetical protein
MMNRKPDFIGIWLCVCVTLLAQGCATIVGSTTEAVQITSDPPGAHVSIKNHKGTEVFRGQAPTTAVLRKGAGYFRGCEYMMSASMEGYHDKTVPLERGLSAWYYLGNIVFGGLIGILIVDPASGAMWTLEENPPQIILEARPEATALAASVTPEISPPSDASLATATTPIRALPPVPSTAALPKADDQREAPGVTPAATTRTSASSAASTKSSDPPKKAEVSFLGETVELSEIRENRGDGTIIVTRDGTMWLVEEIDRIDTQFWRSWEKVLVKRTTMSVDGVATTFYQLVNLDEDADTEVGVKPIRH